MVQTDQHSDMVIEVERLVEQACAQNANVFGYGIWTHHIKKVVENARTLAAMFGADKGVVELAALLHDYASVKDQRLYQEHHIHSSREAERILRQCGCPQEKIEAVRDCIETHRGSVPRERRTPEAECLANADAMSHFLNVPSLLHLAFVQHRLGIDEGAAWVRAKLVRSWKKLTPELQVMMKDEYESALRVLAAEDRCENQQSG